MWATFHMELQSFSVLQIEGFGNDDPQDNSLVELRLRRIKGLRKLAHDNMPVLVGRDDSFDNGNRQATASDSSVDRSCRPMCTTGARDVSAGFGGRVATMRSCD